MRIGLSAGLAATAFFIPVAAQAAQPAASDVDAEAKPAASARDDRWESRDYHQQSSREIVVTGGLPTARGDMLSSVAVIQGADLTQALRPSIGETLQRTAGVSATSFGPTASRPVLRGLQGERVRLLSDGLGSIDVSNTSADHAAAVNPLLADRIEVLRGPQSLLYGSAAIGGVVNVIDKRIPVSVPDEAIHVEALAGYATAARERSLSGSVDAPLGGGWVAHADGSYLKSDDIRIGGHALTPALRAQALASALLPEQPHDHDHHDESGHGHGQDVDFTANAAVKGRLPNTASKTWTAGAGLAWIGDSGTIGVSYSRYDSLYGVPLRFATQPGQNQEAPRLSLVQNRFDARAEFHTGGGLLNKVAMRFSQASYRHNELDESGEIGTAFTNKGLEGRLELTQTKRGAWRGVTGAQFFTRDFNVVGAEAFLPKNRTAQVGLFTLQQLDYGRFKLEAGARYEHTRLKALPDAGQTQFFTGSRDFDVASASLGASYGLFGNWRLGINLSRTARAPAAEELFAHGPHAGTSSYEIGNPDFRIERSWGAEAILRGRGANYSFEASAYHSWFSNFIYEDRTGAIEDGLPVYAFQQAGARYYGFEMQGSLTLARFGASKLVADGLADYVRATIKGSGPAPRIPPLRLLGGLGVESPKLDLRGEVERVTGQDRTAAFETPTKGYTLVNLEASIRPWGADRPLSFALSANNLFDVNARRHASVLKDYAPLGGRDLRISARVSF